MTAFTPQAIDGLPTFWKDCVKTQDVELLDELLSAHGDAPVGAIALALGSLWLVEQLDARGRGPGTWPAEAWWTLVGLGAKPPHNQTADGRRTFLIAQARNEQLLWEKTQEAAVVCFRPDDWAVMVGGAMDHPNPRVLRTWVARAKGAGIDLTGLMVPPGPALLGQVRNAGCLARVAWTGNHRQALEALVQAGLRLDVPEPQGPDAWACPGWTLRGQMDKERADMPWLSRKIQEWEPLLPLSRAVALDERLIAPAAPASRGPRF